MEYVKLGGSDLDISRIGLGCMSLPASDEALGIRIIHRALDLGINYLDTADIYDRGGNEILVGKAIRGRRDKIVLATKVGNVWKADGNGLDWNPRNEYILKAVDDSLRRLGTDHIDLYQLHGGTLDDNIDETIGAFESLREAGKIRYYGISSIRPNVIRAYVKRSQIVSVMMQYSLLDRRPEEEMLDLLCENNIGVLARGALAQGMLAGKLPKAYLGHSAEVVAQAAEAVKSVAREEGTTEPAAPLSANKKRTAAQAAIRYVLQGRGVAAAVVGASRLAQLEEVAGTSDLNSLDEREYGLLASSVPAVRYELHR